MAPLTSKSWLGLVFVALGYLITCCSAATYHRMQDKFDWVDRSCRGREDTFDEAWEEYRALATEANKAVKSSRPKVTTDWMLQAMFQVRPDPRSRSFTKMQEKFQSMKDLGSGGRSTGYYLWCDDSAFEYVDKYESGPRQGEPLPVDDRYWIARRGPRGKEIKWLSRNGNRLCNPDRLNAAFAIGELKLVVLCPLMWDNRTPTRLCEEREWHSSSTSLNSMKNIGSTLYHELTHARLLTEDHAYKFDPCKQLAKDHKTLAMNNADSMTLFALGKMIGAVDTPGLCHESQERKFSDARKYVDGIQHFLGITGVSYLLQSHCRE